MPNIKYQGKKFKPASLEVIDHANRIIAEYLEQGYSLTLRQLFYQFVSRALLPNTMRSYKNLGTVISDGRLAGRIDWEAIEDRTRNLHRLAEWESPADIVDACARQFKVDLWHDQPKRIEVWIEKEALSGVFQRVCDEERCPFFACRGYTSQSEMWSAGQRLISYHRKGQVPVIIHFGDHDPSGIDMSRDIEDRLNLFMGHHLGRCPLEFKRLALNMDQVEEYAPPPNPAKMTDARAQDYVDQYGDESWELDALEPDVLAGLVRDFVRGQRDDELWQRSLEREDEHRRLLRAVSSRWNDLTADL